MNLIWHIVRKDLFRLRWILLLWAVLIATRMIATVIQARLDEFTYQPFYIATALIGAGFLPIFGFGIVMGLMHDDPVIGDEAFWVTRPISNGQLFAAKALGLLLLVLFPIVAAVPWWLSHDFTGGQLGLAATEMFAFQGAIALLALPLVVLSPNGARFVLNVILSGAGYLVLFLLYQLDGTRDRAPAGMVASNLCVAAGIWFVAALVIAGCQFFGRKTRWSLAVLGVTIVVGFSVVRWGRWNLVRPNAEPITASPPVATTVFDPARLTPGLTNHTVLLAGEARRIDVVAEVPALRGQKSAHRGVTLRMGEVFINSLSGGIDVPLGESAPRFSTLPFLPGQSARLEASRLQPGGATKEHYFLVNRSDGRWVAGQARRVGQALHVATTQHTHAVVGFRPGPDSRGMSLDEFVAWSRQAVLLKVISHDPAGNTRITTTASGEPKGHDEAAGELPKESAL